MARKKSLESIDAEMVKVKMELSKIQDKADTLAEKLLDLQEERRNREAAEIIDAYKKSHRSLAEILTFLEV